MQIAVASEYAARLSHELDGKPMDRALLEEIATRADGVVCDLGCGPGHLARFLAEDGASVCGIDLSPRMIDVARRLNPGAPIRGGRHARSRIRRWIDGGGRCDVVTDPLRTRGSRACRTRDRACTGPERHPAGGISQGGSEIRHVEELWSIGVRLDFHFFEPDEIVETLARAGLKAERVLEREPYAGVEVETQRFYVLASKIATLGLDHRKVRAA